MRNVPVDVQEYCFQAAKSESPSALVHIETASCLLIEFLPLGLFLLALLTSFIVAVALIFTNVFIILPIQILSIWFGRKYFRKFSTRKSLLNFYLIKAFLENLFYYILSLYYYGPLHFLSVLILVSTFLEYATTDYVVFSLLLSRRKKFLQRQGLLDHGDIL